MFNGRGWNTLFKTESISSGMNRMFVTCRKSTPPWVFKPDWIFQAYYLHTVKANTIITSVEPRLHAEIHSLPVHGKAVDKWVLGGAKAPSNSD